MAKATKEKQKSKPAPEKEKPPVVETPAPVVVETPKQEVQIMNNAPVTQELITARFTKELTIIKYQEALQKFTSFQITPENIADAQEKMKRVRGFIRQLGAIKDEGKKSALLECRYWDSAYNNVLGPLQQLMAEKDTQLQTVTKKIAEENRKRDEERQRVANIEKDIDNTLLDFAKRIAGATKTDELVAIEKNLGSLKANKSRFQEFLPNFTDRCGELTPLIKKQKELIKELEDLERQRKEAEKADDDRKLLELQEKQEAITTSIEENQIIAQETAISQATRPDIVVAEPISQEVHYRRQTWKWEVKDIKELAKKAPHLVQILPDEEKIDELLKTKKSDGSLKGVEEQTVLGIRFYLEKKA